MATTTNNDHQLLNRSDDGEPLCKRAKYTDDNVCFDLKSLMSYTNHTNDINEPTKSTNVTNQNHEDAGDSGFQDFTSNDSPPSNNSNKDAIVTNENCSSITTNHKQTTFSSTISNSNNSNSIDNSSNNNLNDSQNDLNDIQLKHDLNDSEDSDSIISCFSDLSDLEDAEKWQSNFGSITWAKNQFMQGTDPRHLFGNLLPKNATPSNNFALWKLILDFFSEPPRRKKLDHVNTIDDVVNLIHKSKKIIVLTGAGISVSSGIPDFRSKNGIYARLSVDFPDLANPQSMFDIHYFRKDQRPFFKFAKEIYPGQFKPSISHKFIKQIEINGKLLRNYTQNIDTLEKSANIERVITCHGSFATASCTNCKYQVDGSFIKEDIFAQRIPLCPRCPPDTDALCVLKPDIVFFHESLPMEFHDSMDKDKEECDLLIVIGSSLKVRPVALIPTSISPDVPQILINREHLPQMTFDVELLGDCEIIIQELCNRLGEGWNNLCVNDKLNEIENFNIDQYCKNKKLIDELPSTENLDSNESSSSNIESNEQNLTELIPENSYAFLPPSRYLFKGAQILDSDDEDDDDYSDDSSCIDNVNDLNQNSNLSTTSQSNENNNVKDNQSVNLNQNNLNEDACHQNFNNNIDVNLNDRLNEPTINESELSKPIEFNSPIVSSIDPNNNS